VTTPSDPTSIFITYNGLLDPLGATQGLRYVESLARDRAMHVISFERPERVRQTGALMAMRARVASQGIGWTALPYHKRPPVLAKAWDVMRGARAVRARMARGAVALLHARAYVPMEMAVRAAGGTPILFDIRGLHGEEYLDAGIWTTRSVGYRLLKRSETRFFARADGAVVLTHAIVPYVRERFARAGREVPIAVIPTCVDTDRFRRDEDARQRVRHGLGATDATIVFVYSGSLGTWYMADEMVALVRCVRDRTGREVRLLWLVNNGADIAREASRAAGLADAEWSVASAAPEAVAAHLSGADVGLALIRPTFSHTATAPTKYAEYLAVGLPIVMSEGVGDSRVLVERDVAVAVRFPADDAALRDAADALAPLLGAPVSSRRAVALDMFDVERVAAPAYAALYARLGSPPSGVGGTTARGYPRKP
jgi:glycosyltransferase involved in cell wall biosynthesis